MSAAYTEQDFQEAKAIHELLNEEGCGFFEGGDKCLDCNLIAERISTVRSAARAGMREACAGHGHTFLNGDCLEQCICGHILGPKDMTWEQIQEAQREHIRSVPDLAADEAIERIKREARLEEIRSWAKHVSHDFYCPDKKLGRVENCWVCDRIAALSGKETA